MKLARGQARRVIPPTAPMCRKGPVAWRGKKTQGVSQHQSPCPQNTHAPMPGICTCSQYCWKIYRAREGGTEQTPCSAPATIHQSGGSCSRQDCRGRRSTLPGQAAEVKGRELTSSAHSHAESFSQHLSAQPHGPGTGDSGGVPATEVTHLQGDTCALPLLCPLYSQPCEGCSHHQGSQDQQDLWCMDRALRGAHSILQARQSPPHAFLMNPCKP